MSEQSFFTPPDPELETTEFLQDIASERFLYQLWLDKVATEQKLTATGYVGRFFAIPQFLYGIPGIAKDVAVGFECKTHTDADEYMFDTVTISTEDYPYPVTIKNEHGIYTIEHGNTLLLAPADAQTTVIKSLFSGRDQMKPQKSLVEAVANNSRESVKEDIFETISENDNSVKIVLVTRETGGDSKMTLEVNTLENHPSSALVGTRLTMFDSLESAMEADSSLSIIPDSSVTLDVKNPANKTAFVLTPLSVAEMTFPIAVPKRYHEGHIIEALFSLEQAAKAA